MEIRNLTKTYGDKIIFQNDSFTIPSHTLTAITGTSGRGKTTLLNLIMGFEKPDSGDLSDFKGLKLSAVFQENRLLEHLSALENVTQVASSHRAEELLEALGLKESIHKKVKSFSGGMKRRVALARALAARYDLIILDEPFLALDKKSKNMVIEVTRKEIENRSAILVTNTPEEAELLGASHTIHLQ